MTKEQLNDIISDFFIGCIDYPSTDDAKEDLMAQLAYARGAMSMAKSVMEGFKAEKSEDTE